MNGWARTMVVAALGLMAAGWNGSGGGDLVWVAPGHDPAGAELDAVGTVGDEVQAVLTVDLRNGNTGVLSVVLDRRGAVNRGRLELPSRHVRVGYAEYDPRGLTVFLSGPVIASGRVHALDAGSDVEVELSVELQDRDDRHVWRQLKGVNFALVPLVDSEPDDPPVVHERRGSGGGTVVVHHTDSGGCSGGDDWDDDDGWDDDDSWDSSSSGGGCDGDDFESDSSNSGGGCEGDDMSSSDSGGGCEGDSAGGGSGCEGDAIASDGRRRRRSPWLARAVTWLPWMLVFGFIRVARRDPFRRRGRQA